MGRGPESRMEFAPEDFAGADVIGGVVLGGAMSLVLWAAILSVFIL